MVQGKDHNNCNPQYQRDPIGHLRRLMTGGAAGEKGDVFTFVCANIDGRRNGSVFKVLRRAFCGAEMIVVHHNAKCGTSRHVLELIGAAGYVPEVIPYLEAGWTRPQLLGLFAAAGLSPRSALRVKNTPAEDLGLLGADANEAGILEAMLEHPILVNRPIVCTPKGVRLCRPSELVLDLLDRWPPGPVFSKDGRMILDSAGHRVI